MSVPRAPSGLGSAGRRLWQGTFAPRENGARLELRPDERVLLVEACRLADDVERIRKLLDGVPLMVPGSKGQPVTHPLRSELHRTVASLDRVLRTLALPDDDAPASQAGRSLARARWSA